MESLIHWVASLHKPETLSALVQAGGYLGLSAIIFAETGLLVGFFLPGDSLLITAGVLANPLNPNYLSGISVGILNLVLVVCAIAGDQLGFYFGIKAGNTIWDKPDSRFFKKKYLIAAQDFYKKHGGIAVLGARYVPILRTFVPFAAGMARMPYRNFVLWNIGGGILWISSLLWIGYFLGQTSLANRLDKIIVLVIVVSVLPLAVGAIKSQFKGGKSARAL